jgi:hypothetical protein
MRGCTCKPGKCNCKPKPGYPKNVDEAANPAQQAAIAISKKEEVSEGQPVGFTPEIISVLKKQGYKGPYKLQSLRKWYKELNGYQNLDGNNDIMVQGNDIEFDGWITPWGNEFLTGAENQSGPISVKKLLSQGIAEDWQKVNKKDKTDGMSKKAVSAYRRENPGSKLKTAVTTKPSKLKKGSKSAKRRKSFCARMSGMKKAHASAKTKRDPDSPINKALRRWNCESVEQMQELITLAEQFIAKNKQI